MTATAVRDRARTAKISVPQIVKNNGAGLLQCDSVISCTVV